jgi:HEPN domain-containing protein
MPDRSRDWFDQAVRNLDHAQASSKENRHEWACFAAQQAAELAVKALHLWHGQEAWGHVIARLLTDLPQPAPADLIERAKVLDNFYIPTRYPNGHPEGAPFQHYGTYQSEEAVRNASAIIEYVRARMAEEKPG